MKKNNMLRIASVLLVAVLLSTCAISGVFARYFTPANDSDSARVAKWGVTVSATANAFSAKYDVADDPNFTVVSANGTDKVVAPGTEGNLATITVSGQPEVDVVVTKTATVTLTGWNIPNGVDGEGKAVTKEYCPIVFTVTKGTEKTTIKMDTTIDTIEKLEAAVVAAIIGEGNGTTKTAGVYNYDVNTNLANQGLDVDVDWAWAFGDRSADDTALGDLKTAPTIAVNFAVSVEQVGD